MDDEFALKQCFHCGQDYTSTSMTHDPYCSLECAARAEAESDEDDDDEED